MKLTNNEIAIALEITSRSVQNKRNGYTDWTLPEYQLLIKMYGQEVADKIVNGDSLENL